MKQQKRGILLKPTKKKQKQKTVQLGAYPFAPPPQHKRQRAKKPSAPLWSGRRPWLGLVTGYGKENNRCFAYFLVWALVMFFGFSLFWAFSFLFLLFFLLFMLFLLLSDFLGVGSWYWWRSKHLQSIHIDKGFGGQGRDFEYIVGPGIYILVYEHLVTS